MRKTVTGLLTVILVGVFAAVVFASVDSSSGTPAGTTSEDQTTTTGTGTTTSEDQTTTTGTGTTTSEDQTTTTGTGTTTTEDRAKRHEDRGARREDRRNDRRDDRAHQAGEDISGSCDEAEHANDPRCTGAPGKAEDHHQVEARDDHGADDGAVDDHSGPGRGGDDGADDHSGSGQGGAGDDDSSGHGGGGSDD